MTWTNFIRRQVIASRRRSLASATLCGLSLAVRFTSPAGETVTVQTSTGHDTLGRLLLDRDPRMPGELLPHRRHADGACRDPGGSDASFIRDWQRRAKAEHTTVRGPAPQPFSSL